jgi:lipoprotein-anchoring transpeptidase ErfK/SrfK
MARPRMKRSTKALSAPFPRSAGPSGLLLLALSGLGLASCGDKNAPQEDVTPRDLTDERASKQTAEQQGAHEDAPKDDAPQAVDPDPAQEASLDEDKRHEPPPPHTGPFLWVLRSSAAVYKNARGSRDEKLGYIKRGGKVGVLEPKVEGPDCPNGWYKVASGGFICSHVGTTDENHKDVKFRPAQPNLDEILPYKYARNSKNGTPLYRSIPSTKQSYQYEPYLPGAIEERERLAKLKEQDEQQMREAGLTVGDDPPRAVDPETDKTPLKEKGGADTKAKAEDKATEEKSSPAKTAKKSDKKPKAESDEEAKSLPVGESPDEPEEEIPLWEREENLHEVTLDDLRKDKDDILEMRMMKGFYVAIDKTFQWDGRTWYKTTKGLVTPSANFWQTEGSDFHGVEIDGEKVRLPIGWVIGGRETAPTFEINTETDEVKTKGTKKKFEMLQLEYMYRGVRGTDYFQMADGDWVRDAHIRMTTPGKRPPEVGPNERWLDVDISEQTLVVFEGDRPVYATLISSGKESKVKAQDHSTPRGMWRVREKHVVSTMDGDGSAAGDLPYSIEDVPYIMYFHKSYATHGAFWHRNYGVQMSHGCVNLAPLDAKWIFYYADPPVPPGFHGTWSSDDNPGSMVVVHD